MTIMNREINFYTDTMVIEAILEDPALYTQANTSGTIVSLIDKVKEYFSSKIDPADRTGSIINLIAPGAIFMALSSMGAPAAVGILFNLALKLFGINVADVLRSVYNGIKPIISGGGKVSSSQIDSMVTGAIQANYTPISPEKEQYLATQTSLQKIRDARVVKLAMINSSNNFQKEAFINGVLAMKFLPVLSSIIGWIFKAALASTGFMIAGDITEKFFKSPAATPTTPTTIPISTSTSTSKQKKFPINTSYNISEKFTGANKVQNFTNNKSGISNMLLTFAKEVYDGLDGLDSIIMSTPGFQVLVDNILSFNQSAAGDPIVIIPDIFISKKQLVDYFIDDVAAKVVK